MFIFIILFIVIISGISLVNASDIQSNITQDNSISTNNYSTTTSQDIQTDNKYTDKLVTISNNSNTNNSNTDNSKISKTSTKDNIKNDTYTTTTKDKTKIDTQDNTKYTNTSTNKASNSLNTTNIKTATGSTDIYFNASVNDDNGDGSETNPWKTITNSRFETVNTNGTVHIANGVYEVGSIYLYSNVNIIGENKNSTIITGQNTNFEAFSIESGTISMTNLTISNYTQYAILNRGTLILNNTIIANNTGYNGPAIYNLNSLTVINSLLENNTASSTGGAIYSSTTGANVYINNSTFINCKSNSMGGVIFSQYNTLIIDYSNFINNTSINNVGGVIYNKDASLTINNSKFIGNFAKIGGAIVQLENRTSVTNSNFINNTATSYGGAIFDIYSTLKVTGSNFTSNKANYGGAIYTDEANYYFIVQSSIFSSNNATYGGAIFSNQNRITISNNTFNNNYALNNSNLFIQNNVTSTIYNNNWNSSSITNNKDPNIALTAIVDTINVINPAADNVTIPSSYDLRDYGYVTAVKDQGSGGNCWDFATIASLESCLSKQTGINYSFSENNMKNLLAAYSEYGWGIDPNEGGVSQMSTAYLASWFGPILSSEEGYVPTDTLSAVLNATLHVQNVYGLAVRKNFTDNDAIKEAIMKYGGVVTTISMYTSYLNYITDAYYYNGEPMISNHMVCIVGWDDNYNKSNFKSTPPGDGAFICKNSWGSYWGDDGYCYVSYYDVGFTDINLTNIPTSYVFVFNNTDDYTTNYQYDFGGVTDWIATNSSNGWYANQYTATSNDPLTAISTYFYQPENYTAYIYVNNVLKYTQSGSNKYAGYITIKLDSYVPLNKGDNFQIVVNIKTNDTNAYIPIESSVKFSADAYTRLVTYTNQSFISNTNIIVNNNGINQANDLYYTTFNDNTYRNATACLKAFTSKSNYDIYFDSSATNDNGNGSIDSPWKTITQDRLNSIANGSIVYIKNGIYNITNTITINNNLTIIGENTNKTIINGLESGNSLFTISNGSIISITAITFNNSKSSNSEKGGAITNNGTLTINKVIFANDTGYNGGAIYNYNKLVVNNSIFDNCSVTNRGGAIISSNGTVELNNNKFNNIQATTETLYLNSTNSLNNNEYNNCSILFKNLNISSVNSAYVNDIITVNITSNLLNPNYYDNNILNKTEYNIYENNVYQTTTTSNKNFTINPTTAGDLNLYITPSISSTNSNVISIEINKVNTTVKVNPVYATAGDTITLKANVTTTNGYAVSGGRLVFKVNGTTLKDINGNTLYATVSNGVAQLNYTVPSSWTKDNLYIIALYGGTSSAYNSAVSKKSTINVAKRIATLSVTTNTTSGIAGQTIRLTAKAYYNGSYIDSGKVVFKLNGKTIRDSLGNPIIVNVTNGIAQLNYTIPNGISSRTYTFTAVYSDSYYNRTEANCSFSTTKMNTSMNLNSITTTAGSTVTVSGIVKDIYNNNIVGKTKVAIKINGLTIGTAYVINGTLKTNITIPSTYKARNYTLSVVMGTTNAYVTCTGTTILTITKT